MTSKFVPAVNSGNIEEIVIKENYYEINVIKKLSRIKASIIKWNSGKYLNSQKETKLYVPAVTLSARDNQKMTIYILSNQTI